MFWRRKKNKSETFKCPKCGQTHTDWPATLTQKLNDACETLEYGLWVSLSERSYEDYKENFNNQNHETGYFGWLCSNIPQYGETTSIPCDVVTKTGNSRPEIFPHQDFDYPFVKDYYQGISKQEAENRIQEMLNR